MKPDFKKMNDLIPCIVQDAATDKVLMLGYMNEAAFDSTLATKKITFFSRSKNRLWVKGETSGNFLELMDVKLDCDKDALLMKALPLGPICHTGTDTCFEEENIGYFLRQLEQIIENRLSGEGTGSYTRSLMEKGMDKVAQKVGEEAVEVVIEAMKTNRDLFINECADLLFHLLVLLKAKNTSLHDVEEVLRKRHLK